MFFPKDDRRFQSSGWEIPGFSQIRDAYLQMSIMYQGAFEQLLPQNTPHRDLILLSSKTFFDMIAPTNFPWTNPDVIQQAFETGGKSLYQGFLNFQKDHLSSKTWGLPATTNLEMFEIGRNIATTKGSVIFENALCQLLYYAPVTPKTHEIPLLIVPPWINKFYIFDLSSHNSFVKWNLEQGRPIFIISWHNPDTSSKVLTFEDYLFEGIDTCLDYVCTTTESKAANLLGLCVGGTALLALLSYYAKTGQDKKVSSATLLATPVDFSYLKELSLFVQPETLEKIQVLVNQTGIIPGPLIMYAFFLLRSHELIWSHHVNQYLLGNEPPPIDFLYWNADPLNIPGNMHLQFLRDFFLKNSLMSKTLTIRNEIIDITAITTPLFALATRKDHICPWESLYALKQKLPQTCFVLGGSGHIAGVINPPDQKKYDYSYCDDCLLDSAQEWLEHATTHTGSWWTFWNVWMKKYDGKEALPQFIEGFEAAPGRYVKKSC